MMAEMSRLVGERHSDMFWIILVFFCFEFISKSIQIPWFALCSQKNMIFLAVFEDLYITAVSRQVGSLKIMSCPSESVSLSGALPSEVFHALNADAIARRSPNSGIREDCDLSF